MQLVSRKNDLGETPSHARFSPDGKFVIFVTEDERYSLFTLGSGQIKQLPISKQEIPFQWSTDARSVYVFQSEELPVRIFAVDVVTGKRKFIRELLPHDATGVTSINTICLLPDGEHYAYDFDVNLGTLYLVKGVD